MMKAIASALGVEFKPVTRNEVAKCALATVISIGGVFAAVIAVTSIATGIYPNWGMVAESLLHLIGIG